MRNNSKSDTTHNEMIERALTFQKSWEGDPRQITRMMSEFAVQELAQLRNDTHKLATKWRADANSIISACPCYECEKEVSGYEQCADELEEIVKLNLKKL